MSEYNLELAQEADIPAILGIYASLVGTPGCTWDDEYPCLESAQEDIARNSLYLLKRDGELVAVASAGPFDELGHLPWTPRHPCELARIGVSPAWQGQGVGSALLQRIIQAAKARGFDGIIMLVSKTNAPALAMYHKNGFVRCGEAYMFEMEFYCYEMAF